MRYEEMILVEAYCLIFGGKIKEVKMLVVRMTSITNKECTMVKPSEVSQWWVSILIPINMSKSASPNFK
jgi:hypothetical protein